MNTGDAAARNTVVDIEIENIDDMWIVPSSFFAPNRSPWQTNPQEHIYVDSYGMEKKNRSAHVRQRLKEIAPSVKESLISIHILGPVDCGYGNDFHFNISCTAVDASGANTKETFSPSVRFTELISVNSKDYKDIIESEG